MRGGVGKSRVWSVPQGSAPRGKGEPARGSGCPRGQKAGWERGLRVLDARRRKQVGQEAEISSTDAAEK